MRIASHLPARAGVGFKPAHFRDILAAPPAGRLLRSPRGELHGRRRAAACAACRVARALCAVGPRRRAVDRLDAAARSRASGSAEELCDRYEPESFSEHLAWSSHDGVYFNDLLPLPYTPQTLARVAEHIDEVQTALGRQMLLENPSTYLGFAESTIPEVEFLAEVAQRTGCGLLLDVNNVFVSAKNHRHRAVDPIWTRFRSNGSREIHLGGHHEETDEAGAPLLIDAHGSPVADAVWALYADVHRPHRTASDPDRMGQ